MKTQKQIPKTGNYQKVIFMYFLLIHFTRKIPNKGAHSQNNQKNINKSRRNFA